MSVSTNENHGSFKVLNKLSLSMNYYDFPNTMLEKLPIK